jgi:hypothetical protein
VVTYPLTDIEGVDEATAKLLKSAGIRSTGTLLEKAATLRGRKAVAAKTGIPLDRLLSMVNLADFMRIRGVCREYADLLRAGGVDTVRELKHRNPKNLAERMAAANKARKLVRVLPSEKKVERWIEQARTLPIKITY